jgi:oxygen-independent coproporphyrinogen-3 oxidase
MDWIAQADALLEELNRHELVERGILPPDDRFLPVITYPPLPMVPDATPAQLLASAASARGDRPRAVYLHIPFCRFCCTYCHWVKRIGAPADEVDAYLTLLLEELALTCRWLGVERLRASSVLIGGGTPTYLSAAQLARLLDGLRARVDLTECRQFSVEAEPSSLLGDQGLEKLGVLTARGVDRVSLGVQSFADHVLAGMGRHHTGEDAVQAIAQCRRAGIDSVSIDLIYGCQDQTLGDWVQTLETALAAGADAWQLYRLRVRRHGDVQGVVAERFARERERFPELETVRRMKAVGVLFSQQNGREERFTRIFATHRRHVTLYMWDYCCDLSDVVGLGVSAWSNHDRTFLMNVGVDLPRYAALVRAGDPPVDRGLHRDAELDARRSLITTLKNDRTWKERFRTRTGHEVAALFGPELARLRTLGLVEEGAAWWRLTARGRFFADETVTQLFQRRFLPYPDLAHALTSDG